MTAMIDMAFLLITFFIMSIRFGQAGEEEITLPKADQATEVSEQGVELITINVTPEGTFIVGGVSQSAAVLSRYLRERKEEAGKDVEVVLRGDRNTPFENVQKAMRLSAEAEIPNVSLAALQITEDEEPRH